MAFREFDYLKWIFGELGPDGRVPLGPGDDCAAVRTGGAGLVLVSTDMLVEGSHFTLDIGAEAIGRKSIAVSLSDAAAMGRRPEAVVATVAFTRPTKREFAEDLVRGMIGVCREYNVALVGGDVASWTGPLALSSTVFAFGETDNIIRRAGAAAGDSIYVTGALGGSSLGRHWSFSPRVEEGVFLSDNGFASAMIDVSDGLSRDVRHMTGGGLGARIDAERVTIHADAEKLAVESGKSPLEHALGDGEDFELLLTVHPDKAGDLEKSWKFDVKLTRIGEITAGGGVILMYKDGSGEPLDAFGWEHEIGD